MACAGENLLCGLTLLQMRLFDEALKNNKTNFKNCG